MVERSDIDRLLDEADDRIGTAIDELEDAHKLMQDERRIGRLEGAFLAVVVLGLVMLVW